MCYYYHFYSLHAPYFQIKVQCSLPPTYFIFHPHSRDLGWNYRAWRQDISIFIITCCGSWKPSVGIQSFPSKETRHWMGSELTSQTYYWFALTSSSPGTGTLYSCWLSSHIRLAQFGILFSDIIWFSMGAKAWRHELQSWFHHLQLWTWQDHRINECY